MIKHIYRYINTTVHSFNELLETKYHRLKTIKTSITIIKHSITLCYIVKNSLRLSNISLQALAVFRTISIWDTKTLNCSFTSNG